MALNDYARSNDPFTRVGRQQVAVDVSSVIRASPDSFRVAWVERRYENGQLAETTRWTAILTIVVQIPRNADRLRANPLGIYVNAINLSRELGQLSRISEKPENRLPTHTYSRLSVEPHSRSFC